MSGEETRALRYSGTESPGGASAMGAAGPAPRMGLEGSRRGSEARGRAGNRACVESVPEAAGDHGP